MHNVKNTQVNLETYLESLDANKKESYVSVFGYTYPQNIVIAGKSMNSKIFTRDNLKIAIWQNSMHVLAVISCITATEKARKSITESILKIYEQQNR